MADDFQAAGLGRALLQLTLAVAADRGVEVVARVRYDNQRMMHLLHELGFRCIEWELGVVTFVAQATEIAVRSGRPNSCGVWPCVRGAIGPGDRRCLGPE